MFRSILTTIGSRYLVMIAMLCVVILNTRFMGVAGQGTVALINLGILIQVALSNFIGGGALVYLASRMESGKILAASLLWAVASAGICLVLFQLVPVVPTEFIADTLILGFIQSIIILLMQLLLGREEVSRYNLMVALQPISLVMAIIYFYVMMHDASVQSFIICSYISFVFTLLAALKASKQLLMRPDFSNLHTSFAKIFNYGKFAQGGNIFHLLNLRSQYVLLEWLVAHSRPLVGVLSIGMYAAEAIWNISKSLSVVQYSRISNLNDENKISGITHSFLRISLALGLSATIIAVLIPDGFYQKIFGNGVIGLQGIMLLLAPGLIANCCSVIFSHYFSGTGLHIKNMYASGLGFLCAVAMGLLLIPTLELKGAAIAISVALITQLVYFLFSYSRKIKLKFSDFIFHRSDLEMLRKSTSAEVK
ncbi:MAG: polysaccharide biosynthesis C-terminal domain-containing protein [Flavobacteriales bacterium]|nr:polysaccharide biosynthesis C-terminal domain-containing protein [Flavobacteriales bacterium]